MVILRAATTDDLPFILTAEGADDTRSYINCWSSEAHQAAITDPNAAHRIIMGDGQPVGFMMLFGMQSPHRTIELRRIVVARKGQGYGQAAIRAVQQFVFEELGAHRLWLDVMEDNSRARHVYLASGFREEGLLREAFDRDGMRISLVLMAMLSHEYHAMKG